MAKFLWDVGLPAAVVGALGTGEQQRAREDEKRREATQQNQWMMNYLLQLGNARLLQEQRAEELAAKKLQREAYGTAADVLLQPTSRNVWEMPPVERAETEIGETRTLQIPPSREHQVAAGLLRAGVGVPEIIQRILPKQPEDYTLGPGQQRMRGTEQLAAVPATPERPTVIPQGAGVLRPGELTPSYTQPTKPDRETKMSVEDEFLKALQKDPAMRTPYEQSVIQQYQTGRDRNETLVGLAIRAQKGDKAAQESLDIYRNASDTERREAESRALQIYIQARATRQMEKGRIGSLLPEPQDEIEIARIARALAKGTGSAAVIAVVEGMVGGVSPDIKPSIPQPPARVSPTTTPTPRPGPPASVQPQTGQDTLSRSDPRYQQARQRGLTDVQIQQQFNIRLVD